MPSRPSAGPGEVLPAELRFPVPSPTLVLLGCRPFEARRLDRLTGRPLDEQAPCQVCGGTVRDRDDLVNAGERPTVAYCSACDAMDDHHAANLARQRCEAETGRQATDDRDQQERELARVKAEPGRAELSERERRRIWLGYRKGNPLALVDPQCLAGVGQAWLREIGQEPDFDLIIDRWGHVVGRHSAGGLYTEEAVGRAG